MRADYEKVRKLSSRTNDKIVLTKTRGNPPYRYEIDFNIRSIVGLTFGRPKWGVHHKAEIMLSSSYPLTEPAANMLTPAFHPHIFPSLKICMGRKWVPTEYLDDFVLRIGRILCFDPEYIDPASPANRDALSWLKKNLQLIPTDELEISEKAGVNISWKEKSPKIVDWKERA